MPSDKSDCGVSNDSLSDDAGTSEDKNKDKDPMSDTAVEGNDEGLKEKAVTAKQLWEK